MDIVSAYLSSTLDEEIYINAPKGLGLPKDLTVHVIKALYSLK
jgi:hypothetical protein